MTDIRDTTPLDAAPASTVARPDTSSIALTPQPIDLEGITPQPPRRSALVTVLAAVGAVASTALIASALLFHLHGGSWFIVKTPSMGTAAPVGTLVLTTPARVADLHVGDIIAFHPPTDTGETYTHRIIKISGGLLTTRGDINGATDPWQLTDHNIIGHASVVLPGVGWLIRGLPIVLLGIVIVFLATSRVKSATRKTACRISGISFAVSVAAFFLKPFTGVVVEQVTTTGKHAGATVVSTGLFPIRVQALHGTHTDLLTGQVGHVTVPTSAHQAFYSLSTGLHLSFWGWVIFFGVCCLPLLWTMIVGLPPKEEAVA